ncbi:MAG: phosphopantothenoylcysteine decarboxylase [Mariniphaga sp.]|nr:phosphopantothenoylcysteine decarboxylase [Mariniphaga sp.]MDD4225712.1 phosphopantothenoylcysteine decarboxylase [Mariniphaga sp.]
MDPVRFIGNYSSGKMGYAIAEELAEQGAEVILVSGPVALTTQHKNIQVIFVESAEEMYKACLENFPGCNGAIMTAAVADFTPATIQPDKTKRKDKNLSIELKPTNDIAAALGNIKKKSQLLGGFALETSNEMKNAEEKLLKKNLDFIVLNSLNDKGAGFGGDTNKITFIEKNNKYQAFELKSKREVATDIVKKIIALMQ